MQPIIIDLSGLRAQFNIAASNIDRLTETCVQAVTAAIYSRWQAEARRTLHSTLPEYLQNLHVVTKGRFARQIILTGQLPTMLESGASAWDMKEGFKRSPHVRYSVPVYNASGKVVRKGGDWYLTIPLRFGTPGTVGQAGFANEMPQEIYDLMRRRARNVPLTRAEIPEPYGVPRSRAAIVDKEGRTRFAEYVHRMSIYEGLTKRTAAYNRVVQNTYMTFRRAGKNSDPMAWVHPALEARRLAERAVEGTDVETIVENEVLQYLDSTL